MAAVSLANVALVVLGAPLEGWRAWVLPVGAALAVASRRAVTGGKPVSPAKAPAQEDAARVRDP